MAKLVTRNLLQNLSIVRRLNRVCETTVDVVLGDLVFLKGEKLFSELRIDLVGHERKAYAKRSQKRRGKGAKGRRGKGKKGRRKKGRREGGRGKKGRREEGRREGGAAPDSAAVE